MLTENCEQCVHMGAVRYLCQLVNDRQQIDGVELTPLPVVKALDCTPVLASLDLLREQAVGALVEPGAVK